MSEKTDTKDSANHPAVMSLERGAVRLVRALSQILLSILKTLDELAQETDTAETNSTTHYVNRSS